MKLFRSFALDTQLPDFLGHVKHVIVDAGKYNVPLWRRNGHVADIIGIEELLLHRVENALDVVYFLQF